MRLYTDTYSRNHFPVILETRDSEFWAHRIFSKLDIDFHHYPAFDLYSPSQDQIKSTYMSNNDNVDDWAVLRYATMAGLEHRRQVNIKGRQPVSIDSMAADMIEKERNTFNAKLCKAMADDQLATMRDCEVHAYYGKMLNLLYNFGKERQKLGLYTFYYSTIHFYDDLFISVCYFELRY